MRWQIRTQLLIDLGLAELAGKPYTNRHGIIVNYAPPSAFARSTRTTSKDIQFVARVGMEHIMLTYTLDGKIRQRDYLTEHGLVKALADLGYMPAVAVSRQKTIDKILRDLP